MKEYPCINRDCDDNGIIISADENGEPSPEQCQFCDVNRFPLKEALTTALNQVRQDALEEAIETVEEVTLMTACNECDDKKNVIEALTTLKDK